MKMTYSFLSSRNLSVQQFKELVENTYNFSWIQISSYLVTDPFVCRKHYLALMEQSNHSDKKIEALNIPIAEGQSLDDSSMYNAVSKSAFEAAFLSLYEKNEIPSTVIQNKPIIMDSMFESVISRVDSNSSLFENY